MRTILLAVTLGLPLVMGGEVLAQSADDYASDYAEIMMRMHQDMAMTPTGDADLDFARGMIPHHEGAVAMAELLLIHGTDPALREMAEAVIATQTAEIAFLQDWIAAHPSAD